MRAPTPHTHKHNRLCARTHVHARLRESQNLEKKWAVEFLRAGCCSRLFFVLRAMSLSKVSAGLFVVYLLMCFDH